tara:strand:+ start:190 stop:921 length:732 start_codon:yes stop_codon:yes gene_type:complete
MDTPQRIAKFLSRAGIASRREVERLVVNGSITINGRLINDPATKVKINDKIKVNGDLVVAPDVTRLWRYHKPTGLVTSTVDEQGRKTIFDTLPSHLPRLMSIGRLDIASEGLLLLTNDGSLKRYLELPSAGFVRKYRVRAKGVHDEESLNRLRKGLTIDCEKFRPMVISLDKIQRSNVWYNVALTEGRNREIRRAFGQINMIVNRLIRVNFGMFELGLLSKGKIEEIPANLFLDSWKKKNVSS